MCLIFEMERHILLFRISNYEEHFDGSSGSLAVGAVSQTTSDSGFAETPLTYSTTPPNRRSPDIHQPSSQSMSTSPAASLRGGDRRRTISLSSPCTTMLKNGNCRTKFNVIAKNNASVISGIRHGRPQMRHAKSWFEQHKLHHYP